MTAREEHRPAGRAGDGMPAAALWLGWAGVIPFAVPAIAALFSVEGLPVAPLPALAAYGAAILSFMGGAQWGLAMRAPRPGGAATWRYGVSVLPALLAWICLLAAPRAALWGLGAGFVLLLVYDLAAVRAGVAPGWYRSLRLQLTAAAVLSLLVAALSPA